MLKIRKARQADAEAISVLFCEFVDFHALYDPSYKRSNSAQRNFSELIRSKISSKMALVLVAVENRKIVGYLLAIISEKPPVFKLRRYGTITDLGVTKDRRRSGIGTELYNSCFEWFREKNITRIELGVTTTNPVSNKFWRKLGYKPYYSKLVRTIS